MLTARATAELCRILFADVIAGIAPIEELEDGYPLEQRPEPATPVRRSRRPQPAVTAPPVEVTSPVEGAPREEVAAAPVPDPSQERPPLLPPLPHELAVEDPGPEIGDEPPPATDDELARRKLMALTRDAFPNMRATQRELYRHALTALATRDRADGPKVSSRELTTGEALTLTNLLNDVRSGALLPSSEDGGTVVFASNTKLAVVTPPQTDEGRWTVDIKPR
jgi:hypothetical protein